MKKNNLSEILTKARPFILDINRDISYGHGGWYWFFVRLIYNGIILYYMMTFMKIFFTFIFTSNGVVSDEHLKVITILLWAMGIMHLVMKVGNYKQKDED